MRIDIPEQHQENPVAHVAGSEIVRAGMAYSTAVYVHSELSLREFEAARARTAEINGCRVCQNFRAARDLPGYFASFGGAPASSVIAHGPAPDEAFYRNVANWRSDERYSERERLAIAYSEGMGLDPQGLARDEALWKKLRSAFSDAEIISLTYSIGAWMGLGRATHVLGLDGVCSFVPERDAVGA